MSVVRMQVQTRFARRAGSGKGLSAAEAVAAAEACMETLREDVYGEVAEMLRDMTAARPSIGALDATAERALLAQADALVGLCGLFELNEVGAVASSLCRLLDNCHPGHPDVRTIQVHIDALQALWSLPPEERVQVAPNILDGLCRVVSVVQAADLSYARSKLKTV